MGVRTIGSADPSFSSYSLKENSFTEVKFSLGRNPVGIYISKMVRYGWQKDFGPLKLACSLRLLNYISVPVLYSFSCMVLLVCYYFIIFVMKSRDYVS